jgi:hypothetical protein
MSPELNVTANPGNANGNTAGKKTKRQIDRLSPDLIKDAPGEVAAPEKKIEQDQYFLQIRRKVTGQLGNSAEISQGHDFAGQLDLAAKAKNVGAVISFSVEKGCSEIVLKITTNGQPANHAEPINNAFAQLKEDLAGGQILHQGNASWTAKVNGTTVVEGIFK